MGKDEPDEPREQTAESSGSAKRTASNMKAFIKFRETLDRQIESALLEKMRAFRDELLRSKLK